MTQQGFKFKTSFEPIKPALPLWQLKIERALEFQLIETALEQSGQLRQIIQHSNVDCDLSANAAKFLNVCGSSNLSLSWLLTLCLEKVSISCDSDLATTILSLLGAYQPLDLQRDLSARHEAELGSDFAMEVLASGNPRPKYQWFFMAPDANEWKFLDDVQTANTLLIREFAAEDCGLYRCQIQHSLDVHEDNGLIRPRMYSTCTEVQVKAGSIWLQEVSGPEQQCLLGSNISFFIKSASVEKATCQWYRDGIKLVGEDDSTLLLQEVSLDLKGCYECEISNSLVTVRSHKINLSILLPTEQQLEERDTTSSSENIVILAQPCLRDDSGLGRKCAVGDKISLRCIATCKYPLKYEWIKQGISKDLTGHPHKRQFASGIIRVARSPQIYDEISESSSSRHVSHWIYQCLVTCPRTNERVASNPVKIQMSTFRSSEKCLPSFKVAIVICQEDYEDHDTFVKLNAPKKDCAALVGKLKEMDFEILAFVNLTVEEFRNALELVCALVDESTYVVFYFNGHALNAKRGGGLLLAASDSRVMSATPLREKFISQREVETCLDSCSPLLVVFIYDSCRKEAPEEALLALSSPADEDAEPISLRSSFVRSYATRQLLENFEVSFREASSGIFMKHLLKHIDSKETVGTVFELLTESFTMCEDQSVARNMTPEFENGTKQRMCLAAPLRASRCCRLAQLYFNLCRYEALNPVQEQDQEGGFSSSLALDLGVAWDVGQSGFRWNNQEYSGRLSIRLSPTVFDNEALLTVGLCWDGGTEMLSGRDLSIQVIGMNVQLSYQCPELPMAGHAVLVMYPACTKKPSETFRPNDGPLFEMDAKGRLEGSCLISNLQKLSDPVKIRVILHSNGRSLVCKGVGMFKLPITVNFSGLKVNNLIYKSMYE